MKQVLIFDTTLRDGAQAESVSYSLQDKLHIVEILDSLHVDYIEAGIPGSNPKDQTFFDALKTVSLQHAKICAFGSTAHPHKAPNESRSLCALLEAGTSVVAIVGKASLSQVQNVLGITPDENLKTITASVKFLKEAGKEVIFDAEHFFDGYKENSAYALDCLRAAYEGGADTICLCDTNGGSLPSEIADISKTACDTFTDTTIGIHCHDDIGCAAASTMAAVDAGVTHVQGTFLGLGERCGNAALSTVAPNLVLKCGYSCNMILNKLYGAAGRIADLSNIRLRRSQPYVGKSAFAHKGGLHIDAVQKQSSSFEHVDPECVGNRHHILMSEMAGRSSLLPYLQKLNPDLDKNSPETIALIDIIKAREFDGYQYEGADASLELLVRRHLGQWKPHFNVIMYKLTEDMPAPDGYQQSTAVVKVEVDGKTEMACAMGIGPLHALDTAMRSALSSFYPELLYMRMSDYRVRVLETNRDTDATTRVLMECTDGKGFTCVTVGVSTDIVEASFLALMDAFEYKLSSDQ